MTRDFDVAPLDRLADALAGSDGAEGTQIVRYRVGDRVGSYRLIQRIGQGGMGDVYSADRADNLFRRRVALKLVRTRLDGRDLTVRFDAERRILASLNHPNIARMVDGGVTGHGVPYVVMEYVDGLPFDRYCKGKKLPLSERIKLFLQVCDAVQYAHRNLIVHRDIKPDNILVGEDDKPVLLDFGIAKLLRPELMGISPSETRAGAHMMTPEFASPEQFRGEPVSTASDIYSLGVLLYVLVTDGQLPHASEWLPLTELGRRVCEDDPKPPSRWMGEPAPFMAAHSLEDIDAIVLKALRKEVESRYLSVEELASDLRRYLGGFAVKARDGNWAYRWTKFLRRHRLSVAFSAALAVVTAISAAAMYSFHRDLEQKNDIAQGSLGFVMDLLEGSDPNSRGGRVIAARALLDEASARLLANKFQLRSEARYELSKKVGDIYRQLGAYEQAEPLFQLALGLGEETEGRESQAVANVLVRLADLHRETLRLEEAETEAKRSLQLHRKLFGKKSTQVADSLNVTGILLQMRGKLAESEQVLREAVTVRRAVLSPSDPFLALSLSNLGNVLRDQGNYAAARPCFEEALAIRRKAFGNEHPRVASSLGQLSQIAIAEKKLEEAVRLTDEGVRIARIAYLSDNPDLAKALLNHGNALAKLTRFEESEVVLREALTIQRKARGSEAPETSFVEAALVNILFELGRLDEAESIGRHVLGVRSKTLGSSHHRTADAQISLGNILLRRGKRQEGLALLSAVLAMNLPPGSPELQKAKDTLRAAE
jgi:eukaryotic-like serine/threonine-protein kinase